MARIQSKGETQADFRSQDFKVILYYESFPEGFYSILIKSQLIEHLLNKELLTSSLEKKTFIRS